MIASILSLTLLSATAGPEALPLLPSVQEPLSADWDTLAPHLRLRPYALDLLSKDDRLALDGAVGRPLSNDLRLVLVLDTAGRTGWVQQRTLESWPHSEAEVLQKARAQTLAALAPTLEHFDEALPSRSGPPIRAELWTGGDTASMLVDLDAVAGPAPVGFLVTIPSRTMLVLHRIQPGQPLDEALATFAALTRVGPPDDHTPFSPLLFWWHDGTLHPLRVVDPVGGPPTVVAGPTLDRLQRSVAPPAQP